MQGSIAAMREAVRALDETTRRLRFERAKDAVIDRHRDLYAALAEHERREREGK